MGQTVAPLEWLFWTIAIASAGIALMRASVVSAGQSPGVREKSGIITGLWILCVASAITGFILAVAAVRAGGS